MSTGEARELRKVAEGREAEMFAWGDGAILRLMRSPDATRVNEWQAAAMEAARRSGVPVPEVLGLETVMGRPGLVMERIEGTDLLTLIGRRPWTVLRAGRIGGEAHARLHEVVAPQSLPPLKAALRMRIETLQGLPDELKRFALQALDEMPDGDRLCHGDFHPANVLMKGEEPVIIDWTNATRGDPAADVARTRMMLSMGEPPPGTSAALRVMTMFGRQLMVWLYLRSYRRARALDTGLVAAWRVPVAAARLAEGIQEEFPALMRLLERERAKAG